MITTSALVLLVTGYGPELHEDFGEVLLEVRHAQRMTQVMIRVWRGVRIIYTKRIDPGDPLVAMCALEEARKWIMGGCKDEG